MKRMCLAGLMLAGAAVAQVQDQDGRYAVNSSVIADIRGGRQAAVSQTGKPLVVERRDDADGCSAVLIQYDLSAVPLKTSVNSVIWYKGIASGSGSNPSFTVYGVGNDWDAKTVTLDKAPPKIEKITEVTVQPNVNGPIPFPVNNYIYDHLKDGKVSFLIEMRSAPGFSRAVEFVGPPLLMIAKTQEPLYNLQDLLRPVWKGLRIENETVLPTSYDGKPVEADLALVPSKVISVKNYDLDKTYEPGRDYIFDGRALRLAANSSIPFFKYTDLYPDHPATKPETRKTLNGGYLTFSEGPFFKDKQLAVTYEHKQPWDGPVPVSAEKYLPETFAKLRAGKPLKLVVFGDSISAGASASGVRFWPPHMPRWADLVAYQLRHIYKSKIDYINPSLGGMTSDWGRKTVDGLVSFEKPDLVILGFGMNDAGANAGFSAKQFAENTQAMMDSIRKQNPAAEFILLMSMQPNSCWRSPEPMPEYLEELKKMEGPGVAVADMWSMHGYLLKHKTYWDMTGNHVNHPNDFLVRIYAQALLARLGVQ